jgi:hypothetical protein
MCSCLGGSLHVSAVEGIARFDCITVGMAGLSLPLMLSAGGRHLAMAPLSVEPGVFSALYMVNQPPKLGNIAGEPILICSTDQGCSGIAIQMVDMCGNFLQVQADGELDIEVTVSPAIAGLQGTTSVSTLQGRATFDNLKLLRAKNMPCEIADSVHFVTPQESPCIQRRMPYTLQFFWEGISTTSFEFYVDNANMQSLVVVQQPDNTVQGSLLPIQPQLKLVDGFSNTVTVDRGGGFAIQVAMVTGEGCKQAEKPVCWSNCDGSAINGVCYKYFNLPSTFDEAVDACREWGGELLTVTSSQTNLGVVAPLTGGVPSWIGLKWDQDRSEWIWSDEDGSNTDEYTSWDEANPPMVDQAITGCVFARASLWRAASCNLRLPFVCGNDASDQAQNECNCCAKIMGNSTVIVRGGFAAFTDLRIASEPAIGYRMIFSAINYPLVYGAHVRCAGPCDCQRKNMITTGVIDDGPGQYSNDVTCTWTISSKGTIPDGLRDTLNGEVEISLWFTSFATEVNLDVVTLYRCTNQECQDPVLIQDLHGYEMSHSGPTAARQKTVFYSQTGALQLMFKTSPWKNNYQGFRAEWRIDAVPNIKSVEPPPRWQRATFISERFNVYPRTTALEFVKQPSLSCARQAFVYQPHLRILDSRGQIVMYDEIRVSVSLLSSSTDMEILGTTTKASIGGFVIFTDLQITRASSRPVRLRFSAQGGSPPVPMFVDSNSFPVMAEATRLTILKTTNPPRLVIAGSSLAKVVVEMYDSENYLVFASKTAVSVMLSTATGDERASSPTKGLPLLGTTQRIILDGIVSFDDLIITFASTTTAKLIFSATDVGLNATSTGCERVLK